MLLTRSISGGAKRSRLAGTGGLGNFDGMQNPFTRPHSFGFERMRKLGAATILGDCSRPDPLSNCEPIERTNVCPERSDLSPIPVGLSAFVDRREGLKSCSNESSCPQLSEFLPEGANDQCIGRIESSYVASQLAVCVWVLKDYISALPVGGRGKP